MLNPFINNYFGFNKQQRNGLIVLLLVSFILLVIRLVYPFFMSPGEIIIRDLPLIERRTDSSYTLSKKYPANKSDRHGRQLNMFVFDPNTVTLEQLAQLGFKEKTAKVLLKFRAKGFIFRQKKDLLKVYGISERHYTQLEPYILIEQKETAENPKTEEHRAASSRPQHPTAEKTELNSTDSLRLVAIPGIGPVYAKRILKYRDILGGYISIEQLKEVYGFSAELYETVKHFFSVDGAAVKKLNLNTDDFKVVNKHPYLSYESTKTIFEWRRKTTLTATNLKDILNDNSLYHKLLPYLTFE